MNKQEAHALILKYTEGTATPAERMIVEKYFIVYLDKQTTLPDHTDIENSSKEMLAAIEAATGKMVPVRRLWPRIAAAASVIFVLGFAAYLVLHKQPTVQIAKNDIQPGKNQATLTLANGQKIVLTSSLHGIIAQQGKATIQMNHGITYLGASDQSLQYNTLSTARGEISPLPLVLSDGTKVWLNTASSITYPVAFIGSERKVTVTGEAYFEVVHNAAKPFTVVAGNQIIHDIGTSFDVNAYTDEASSKTTLVEGSVSVNGSVLKPGQQFSAGGISNADVDEILAWKNGKFRFSNEKLSEIMLQASRWYNVDVVYDNDALKNKTFGVIGNRFAKASDLLHTLELIGEVKFIITGNKITVTQP